MAESAVRKAERNDFSEVCARIRVRVPVQQTQLSCLFTPTRWRSCTARSPRRLLRKRPQRRRVMQQNLQPGLGG